jgi:cytochrome P450
VQAFHRFVQGGFIEKGETCELVRQIVEIARRHNRGTDFLARYYFGLFFGFLVNSVPVTFWTISHIIRNPDLLARIRTELKGVARETVTPDGIRMRILDISAIKEQCPLLLSTFHETLRYVGSSISTLVVHEDVWLDDTYLLTKGSLVQIAATAIHSDPNIWGRDAAIFDPERFQAAPNKVHPSANRTFGGGNTLCPGRHLALDEVLAVTAMFLSTFNVALDAGPTGPRRDETNMLTVIKPRDDLSLKLTRYPDMEKVLWGVES